MKPILFILFFCCFNCLYAQKFCGQYEKTQELYQKHPELQQHIRDAEEQLNQEGLAPKSQKRATSGCYTYVIPVVFHILHNNGPENIPDHRIYEMIRRINLDYNKRNADTAFIDPEFAPIASSAQIEFRLAKIDPQGNPTTGIIRYETTDTYDSNLPFMYGRSWPRSKYLNVFTTYDLGSLYGLSFFPYSVDSLPEEDAVYLRYDAAWGDLPIFTHEIGHWLNLYHPFGNTDAVGNPSNCGLSDGVANTPPTIGWTTCDLNGATCGSPKDNVQNYMDYSFCNSMFTQGQADRIHTALNSSVAQRNLLWQDSNLVATGVANLTAADFFCSKKVVCTGENLQLFDASTYGACAWTWTVSGPETMTSLEQFPVFHFNQPGLYTVSLTASNDQTTVSVVKTDEIMVVSKDSLYLPFSESFENTSIPNETWRLQKPDSWTITDTAYTSSTHSVTIENSPVIANQEFELYHTGLDLSVASDATIYFKLAFAQRLSINNDILRIYMSADCGQTWYSEWAKIGHNLKTTAPTSSFFIPNNTQWITQTAVIPEEYLVENMMFKFYFKSDGGNNIYIDDINVDVDYHDFPILSSPQDLTSTTPDVVLDWKSVDMADVYEYYLDTTPSFNSGLLVSGTTSFISTYPHGPDTRFSINGLIPDQSYYWKVRTNTDGAYSSWSETWNFITDIVAQTPLLFGANPKKFQVFPNPFNDLVTIEAHNTEMFTAEVRNLEGQLVFRQTGQGKLLLSLINISSGIYILSVKQNDALQHVQKVIKL